MNNKMLNIIGLSGMVSFILGIMLLFFGVWIWSLVDCIKSDKETSEKILWIIIIVFFNFIGSFIYLILKLISNSNDEENNYANNQNNESNDERIKKVNKKTTKEHKEKKLLVRSSNNKVLGGVCSGIGNYLDIDPVIIRLLFVLLVLFRGSGILIYLICWIIIPEENNKEINDTTRYKNKDKNNKNTLKTTRNKKEFSLKKKSDNKFLRNTVVICIAISVLFFFILVVSISRYQNDFSRVSHKEIFIQQDYVVTLNEEGLVVRKTVSEDNQGIQNEDFHEVSNIVKRTIPIDKQNNQESDITNFIVTRNRLEERILNDYNYIFHNGSNLKYLGVETDSNCIIKQKSFDNCFTMMFEFNVNSSKLPRNVESFIVESTIINNKIQNISFSEKTLN